MSQAGYTPIQLYYSTTASAVPVNTNLANGELAINITDGKLYYKNNSGVVTLLTSTGSEISPITNNGVVYINGSGQATSGSALTFDGTNLSNSGNYVSTASVGRFAKSNITGRNLLTGGTTGGTTDGAYIITEGYDYGGTAAGGAINLVTAGASSPITFLINGSEQMRLTSTGLGIGTSSPAYKLDVRGSSGTGISFIETTSGNTNRIQLGTGSGFGFINADAGTGSIALALQVGGTTKATLDGSGNLGLGVTPSGWNTSWKAIQVGANSALTSQGSVTDLQYNTYRNTSNIDTYISSDFATRYRQISGTHTWSTAAAGTAGSAISFTQSMTLDASGNLGVGTTSPSTRLHAKGTGGTIATFERDASGTIAYFNRNAGGGNAGAIIGADSVAGYFAGGNSTSNMVYLDSVNNLAQFFTNGSERLRIASNGAWGLAGANYGTSGQVLTSNGSGSAPTWQAGGGGGGSAATPTALGTVYGTMSSSASSNLGLGFAALVSITSGSGNTAVGYSAGDDITTGTQNTIMGYGAYGAVSTASYNSAFGYQALAVNTSGTQNAAFGWFALQKNTTGGGNVSLGAYSMHENSSGGSNTAIGFEALGANTTASNNTAVGYQSLYTNTTGDISVAVGNNALKAQTTATQNTAMGYNAGTKLTTSSYNVAIGTSALANMINGANSNVAIGQNALTNYVNTSVSEGGAVAVGASALQNCTTGGSNIAMGRNAGLSITTGALNVVIGDRAGESANSNYGVYLGSFCGIYTTGDYNTFIGWQAGHNATSTTTGSSNIYVGAAARGSSVSSTSEIVIGVSATAKGSSTGFINPNNGGVYQGNNSSTWSTTSDQRLKKNIVDNNDGLDKITSIRVRNFEYRLPEEVDAELKPADAINKTGVQLGVIAQELQAVLPECVKQESTGVLSVDTDNLTWYLINAVKELSARVKQLEGN